MAKSTSLRIGDEGIAAALDEMAGFAFTPVDSDVDILIDITLTSTRASDACNCILTPTPPVVNHPTPLSGRICHHLRRPMRKVSHRWRIAKPDPPTPPANRVEQRVSDIRGSQFGR